MEEALRRWLAQMDYPAAGDLREMNRGLGSTELWSFRPGPGESRLVVRVFSAGSFAAAEREALAMDAATRCDLPVPAVVARGAIEDRPALVTSFVEGVPAVQALIADRDRAEAIGYAMGEVLGRIHQVTAPEGISRPGSWIERGGPSLASLRSELEAVPVQDRLLHLDYHALNVLMDDGRITGVIDWENTTAGPPHMDLARSRAILRVVAIGKANPALDAGTIERVERGLVEGHAATYGPDPDPNLSMTWGLAMTTEDLAEQARKPGSPIPRALVDRLAQERDALIRQLVECMAMSRDSNDAG